MTDLKQILSEAAKLADHLAATLIDDIRLELDEEGVFVCTVDPCESPGACGQSPFVAWDAIEEDSTAILQAINEEAARQRKVYDLPALDTTPHTSDFGTTQIKTQGRDSA